MRIFVAVLGIGSTVAALALLVVLAIENRSWGHSADILWLIILFTAIPLFSLYHVYRMLRTAYRPDFPKANLGPVAALLILGGIVGLALAGMSISAGPHGATGFILGLLFQLAMVCVARYKFAA